MNKQLHTPVMIYDDQCPLCSAYTKGFVRMGMLDKANRLAFSELEPGLAEIDWNRARHEIPLVDKETGQVWYGVDALLRILQVRFPILLLLMRIKIINYLVRKLYKLISYNRRIIVAASHNSTCGIDCTPDYHGGYRWLLILLTFSTSNLFLQSPMHAWWPDIKYGWLLWMMLPLLLAQGKTARRATDTFAHSGIIALLFSFSLWFFNNLQELLKSTYPGILIVGFLATATLTMQQISLRIKAMQ